MIESSSTPATDALQQLLKLQDFESSPNQQTTQRVNEPGSLEKRSRWHVLDMTSLLEASEEIEGCHSFPTIHWPTTNNRDSYHLRASHTAWRFWGRDCSSWSLRSTRLHKHLVATIAVRNTRTYNIQLQQRWHCRLTRFIRTSSQQKPSLLNTRRANASTRTTTKEVSKGIAEYSLPNGTRLDCPRGLWCARISLYTEDSFFEGCCQTSQERKEGIFIIRRRGGVLKSTFGNGSVAVGRSCHLSILIVTRGFYIAGFSCCSWAKGTSNEPFGYWSTSFRGQLRIYNGSDRKITSFPKFAMADSMQQ